jgi:hypothetical protein
VRVYPDEDGDWRGADGAAAARSRHGGAAGSAELGVAARRLQHQVGGRRAAAPHFAAALSMRARARAT